jgi:hypothetical protein
MRTSLLLLMLVAGASLGFASLNGTFGRRRPETMSADAHAAFGVLDSSTSSSFSVTGAPESVFVAASGPCPSDLFG